MNVTVSLSDPGGRAERDELPGLQAAGPPDSGREGRGDVFRKEGEPVTLKCSYKTSSEDVYLFWYRQYPNRALQYLLLRGARTRSGGDHTADDRFESTAKRSSTELTVGELRKADTALYYCALQVIGAQ